MNNIKQMFHRFNIFKPITLKKLFAIVNFIRLAPIELVNLEHTGCQNSLFFFSKSNESLNKWNFLKQKLLVNEN